MENENEIHSKFLLNETTKSLSLPITTQVRGTLSGVVDAKLNIFWQLFNGVENNNIMRLHRTHDIC